MAKKDEINKSMHEWMFKNNPGDKDGKTLLHWAAEKGHLDICKSIIEEVEDKNPKDKKGWTPLHEAAREDHKERGYLLIGKMISASGFLCSANIYFTQNISKAIQEYFSID